MDRSYRFAHAAVYIILIAMITDVVFVGYPLAFAVLLSLGVVLILPLSWILVVKYGDAIPFW